MNAETTTHSHIDITETLVRLYVFLAQDLDRCLDLAARQTYPEHELQSHLFVNTSYNDGDAFGEPGGQGEGRAGV